MGSHARWLYHMCVCLTPMSTTYVDVGAVSVLTEMEGLQGIIHVSGKPYFGQGKVRQGSQGNFRSFKSLEIDFSIKVLLSPLVQPMDPFCLSGGPFHCCEFL